MHKNRISKLFDILKTKNKSALGIFITAGDPNIEVSQKILDRLPSNGADFIELGTVSYTHLTLPTKRIV